MTEKKQYPDWVATPLGIFAVIEFIAILIALALPVTPSKTGSDMDIASLFIEDPGYIENVLVAFVVTNLLIGLIGLLSFVYLRFRKDDSEPDSLNEEESHLESISEDDSHRTA